jgi:TRAP-type mannitol/chloroaromatic compound transport system permease small subunit
VFSQDPQQSARKKRGRSFGRLDRYWSMVVDGLAALGTLMIGGLMLVVCADILFRNLLGSSLPLVSELGGLMLVMIVYLQLATTVRADRLAKTEIFLPLFKRRFPVLGGLIDAVFNLVGACMIALIAWSTVRILEKDLTSGEFIGVPGIATVQTWPFRVLILVGVTVASLEFIVRAISCVHDVSRKSETS